MRYLRKLVYLVFLTAVSVSAQTYPNKPIKMVVGYAPGGAVDIVGRSIAQTISGNLGQPIVVENKPGAGTNIAVKFVIDSPPDGYTLLMAANALAANMALYQPAPFDAEKELTPVSLVGRVPVVLAVNATSQVNNLKQLMAHAKQNPGQWNYGTPGNGSTPHMAVEFFEKAAKVSFKHIPYRGGTQAITDVIGGQLDMVAVNALEVSPHVKSGKLKVIAVLSAKRSPIFPEVATIAESGFPGFEASVWYGVVAPAGTPRPIIDRLHAEIQKALSTQEIKDRMASVGGEVNPGTVEMFRKLIHDERVRYEKLVREANIKPD